MTLDRVPPCPRCGAAVGVHEPRLEHLPMYGWRLFAEASVVNACGHRQEWLLVPGRGPRDGAARADSPRRRVSAWTAADWFGLLASLVLLSLGAALVERWHERRWMRRLRER